MRTIQILLFTCLYIFKFNNSRLIQICRENMGCYILPDFPPDSPCKCFLYGLPSMVCYDYVSLYIPVNQISLDNVTDAFLSHGSGVIDSFTRYMKIYGGCIIFHIADLGPFTLRIINTCPDSYTDNETREFCEESSLLPPVEYVGKLNIPFKNIYCAKCHGLTDDVIAVNVEPWKAEIQCQDKLISRWGDVQNGLDDGGCKKSYLPPTRRNLCHLRNVIKNVTSSECQTCLDGILPLDSNLTLETLECTLCRIVFVLLVKNRCDEYSHQVEADLTVLFTLPTESEVRLKINGGLFKSSEICSANENFDLLFQKCREFHCGDNQYAKNGKCIDNTSIYVPSDIQPLFPNGTKIFNVTITTIDVNPMDILWPVISSLQKNLGADFTTLQEPFIEDDGIDGQYNGLSRATAIYQYFLFDDSVEMALDRFDSMPRIHLENLEFQLTNFLPEINQKTVCKDGDYLCFNNTSLHFLKESLYANVSYGNITLHFPVNTILFNIKFGYPNIPIEISEICACYQEHDHTNGLNCSFLIYKYEHDEYTQLEDGRLKLLDTELIFNETQFRVVNGTTAFICYDPENMLVKFFDLNNIQKYLSWVCCGISVIFLLITLAIYTMLVEIRNLPGMITICLAISLISGQSLLFIPQIGTYICRYIAAFTHFSWMSAFMWMSAQAVNVLITFHPKTHSLNGNQEMVKFRTYLGVCVSVPLAIVITCLILDLTPGDHIHVHYGQITCSWMSDKYGSIFAFLVPVGITMASNALCFGLTLYYIEQVMKRSENVAGRKREKTRCIIYIKLATVMGFSWIFGFIASFLNITALWYVYIILNGLQGFLIFLSFAINSRTRQLLRNKFSSISTSNVYTTSTNTNRELGK